MRRISRRVALLLLVFGASSAAAQEQPRPADPLTVAVDVTDAQRFADMWVKSDGQPTLAQLEDYIRGGGPGVKIYTPNRIVDAANLQRQITAHRELYSEAVTKCLPWVPTANAELRSIYLALKGLLPEKPLPQIYMVVGGANSGGTVGPGAQVLGLEILCRDGPTPEKFIKLLRTFFAHETAHTFQRQKFTQAALAEPLLTQILLEGGPDYVASLVTGASPDRARDAYGQAHAAELWKQFAKDRPTANRDFSSDKGYGKSGQAAFNHWLYNADRKPDGWETDMGYWLGMQIAKAYVERAADPHAAIRDVLALEDPAEILRKSGYAAQFVNRR